MKFLTSLRNSKRQNSKQANGTTKDMTSGNPMSLILGFTIPTLIGLLFQQFYSLVDTIIVGKCIGVNALAAVGSTGSINFMILGFCMGICSGFAIPIAQRFGAGDYESLRKFLANSIYLSILFSVVITIIVAIFCRSILILMDTPADILEDAYKYIYIIFLGIPVTFLYNLTSGVLRSLGDSKTPVYFLLLASVINICLDLWFIASIGMGVKGAAYATVISQFIAGSGCLIYMIFKYPILHISRYEAVFDKHYVSLLCNMGVPMGLQYSITAIGSVILQHATNSLGSSAVASVTAASKLNLFIVCPFDAMGATMATYGGQNIGAKKLLRIKQGLKDCIILGAGYSVISLIIIALLGKKLLLLFLDAKETVILNNAYHFLFITALFYFLLALVNIVRFLIQGMGFPRFAILAGVCEMIARTLVSLVLVPNFGFNGVCFAHPAAWIMADAFLIPAFFYVYKKMEQVFN